MALAWLLLSVRCTKNQHTTLWWLCRGFCSVSDVQKNNIQHCDGIVVASAQCQMYKKTTYNTVMALSWLLLSVRCTKKQYTTLWWLCHGFCSVSDVQTTIYNTVMALSWLCHGFCSVPDVQKNNIQHCDGFVMASAQCQMYKKTIYNTVMALSWLLLSVRCTNNNIQHCDGFVMALSWLLLSVRCTKKQHTTLWWLCHGFCSVSDVQKNNIQHWLCHGFYSVSDVQKNNIQHCDGFVVASAQCQMYKKTTYNTVMALSWLLLSVWCTKKQYTTLWWLCRGFCSVSDVKQYTTLWWLCHGFCSVSDVQTTIYNTVMALSWLCHGFCSVSDVQKNNMQHCDGFVMASAQCQMYKKTIYSTVMALSWLLLSVRCTKKQYTTLWWLCRGFCSVSDVQKNNIQHCDGFVMASAGFCSWLLLSVRCTNNNIQHCDGFVMALSWLLLSVRCTKKQHTTLWWLCHGFCSVSDVQNNNIQHCDGFVMASAQCQMYKKTIYNTVMALSWLLLNVRCTKKQHTTLWWLCHGFCSVSDVQKNNIQHCDGYAVASAQCQMYNNIQHCDGFVMASAQCQMYKQQYTTLWWLCHGFVMASAQCQMYKKTICNIVMALSWLLLSVRCTKNRYTALWWLCHGFCSMSDV